MLLLTLLNLAQAEEPGPALEPVAEPAEPTRPPRERGLRLYLGGGDATSAGAHGAVGALGAQLTERGRRVGGAYGLEFLAYQADGSSFPVPVFSLDAALRFTPWPGAKLVPYATAGLGGTLIVIVPFPAATLSLGAELPLGDLRLDAELHARAILPLYPGTQQVNVAMLRVGLGF